MAIKGKHWINIGSPMRAESEQGVYSATYTLADLAEKCSIDKDEFQKFRRANRQKDFYGALIGLGETSSSPGDATE